MKRITLLITALLTTTIGFSQSGNVENVGSTIPQPVLIEKVEAQEGKIIIPYEKWQLPNGLIVIIHEDHSCRG